MRATWKFPLLVAAPVAVLVAPAACSRAGLSTPSGFTPEQPTVVTVRNHHWLEVAVYAVRGATRFRIGTVPGLGTATLRLGAAFTPTGSVRLLADPIGSRQTFLTEPIVVSPGQRIALTLQSDLRTSFVAVWNR